jgi:RNA polymerase-associated protein CTR9
MALETTGTSQPQNGGDHVTVEKIGGEETEASGSSLIIPISSSSANDDNLFIEIFPEEMADTPAPTLLQVLKDENADLNVWADAGLQYMQQKLSRQSLTILEEACDLPVSDKNQRVRILAATGIAHLAASATTAGSGGLKRGPAGSDPKDELRQQADQKFTQAGKVDTFFPMTWMGRGMLNLSAGRLDQARFFFDTTLKQCGPVMPALLGMAAVMFGEGNYKESLKHYETAIRKYPVKSGAPARVGFGLCCYRLGQIDRSKAAFARALALDPENVEAMVGAAILDMAGLDETAKDFSARTEKAIKMMSMANLLNHSNAMVQNHLANHYFWKWTPVTGTVEVTQGSTLVKGSQPIPLDPGERIRIGTKFESTVVEDVTLDDDDDSTNFRMHEAWKESSTGMYRIMFNDWG